VQLAEKRLHYLSKVREMEVKIKTEVGFAEKQGKEKNTDYKRVGSSERQETG
jgi:hypothetical protein